MYFDSIFFSRIFSPFRLSIDLLVFLIFGTGFFFCSCSVIFQFPVQRAC